MEPYNTFLNNREISERGFLIQIIWAELGHTFFKRKYESLTNIKNEISMTAYNFFFELELHKTARKVKQEAYFK